MPKWGPKGHVKQQNVIFEQVQETEKIGLLNFPKERSSESVTYFQENRERENR